MPKALTSSKPSPPVSVRGVQTPEIVTFWGLIKPLIEKALTQNHRFSSDDIKDLLLSGKAQLWESGDFQSILITEVQLYPKAKVLNLFLNSGELDLESLQAIEAWAKAIGCTEIEETGRKGWERLLKGYEKVATTMRKKLL